jgi:hypothetical protein
MIRQATSTPGRRPARDPRRLGLGAAGIIAGYALVLGAISAGVGGLTDGGEFAPPEVVPRPFVLVALGMLPAVLAAIGALRRSRPVLIAAGLLCLGQAFISFSGVTIPFVVPAFLLLALGLQDSGTETSWRAMVGGVFVVALGIGAWVAPFASTETTCWVARTGADGAVVYVRTPVPEGASFGFSGGQVGLQMAPGDLAAGCGGGELTVQGAGLAAVFEIGAVALAALASVAPPAKAPRQEFA